MLFTPLHRPKSMSIKKKAVRSDFPAMKRRKTPRSNQLPRTTSTAGTHGRKGG
jgi:hypothetical protein